MAVRISGFAVMSRTGRLRTSWPKDGCQRVDEGRQPPDDSLRRVPYSWWLRGRMQGIMTQTRMTGQHVRLSLSLFARHGARLTAIWAGVALLHELFLRLAVEIGMHSRLLGLFAIAPVILLQLLLFVSAFVILQGRAPELGRRAGGVTQAGGPATDPGISLLAGALLAVLIPFYGYYAGWGLLSETLRDYSQLFWQTQMRRMDLTQPELSPTALEIGQSGGVVLAVVLIWLIRRFSKARQAGGGPAGWALVVVACEASWALLGLYVLSGWKGQFADWLAVLPSPAEMIDRIVPAAGAAVSTVPYPIDWPPPFQLWPFLNALFWYALLPVIWFNMGAIVHGHDLTRIAAPTRRLAGSALERWGALPKALRDFIGHFWAGVVKRWNAVANGVMLAASAGVTLTVSVIVLWRLVDWVGNWAWIGLAHLIGPQDFASWQVIGVPLSLLFGTPGGMPGGILVGPLQFCILSAGLQLAARAAPVRVAGASPA